MCRRPEHAAPEEAPPLMVEASLQLCAGEGVLLTPSFVCARGSHGLTPAVALRSELRF